MDCGFYSLKLQGLFSKFTPDGVSSFLGHQIRNQWPRLDGRGRGRRRRPEQVLLRRRSMADGKKVAGVVRAGSLGHDFPKRKHWEREGDKASPYWGKTRPDERPTWRFSEAPCRRPRSSRPEHQGASNRSGNGLGESGDEGELTTTKNVGGGGSNRR